MSHTKLIAKHLREVYFGGNWTTSNVKDHLSTITWQQATATVYDFNSIALLLYHATYYTNVLIQVFNGQPLTAKDADSFLLPPIHSEEDWQALQTKAMADAELAAALIEQLPDAILTEYFIHEKYGNYYRNLHGIIEHLHYHLGQIVLIKKIVQLNEEKGKTNHSYNI